MSCNQFAISASSPLRSFAFPEDQVQAAADQSHGEADPGKDVGGAVGALLEAGHVEAVLLIRVDGGCDHHAQAWWERVGRSSDLSFKKKKCHTVQVCHEMSELNRNMASTKIVLNANC